MIWVEKWGDHIKNARIPLQLSSNGTDPDDKWRIANNEM